MHLMLYEVVFTKPTVSGSLGTLLWEVGVDTAMAILISVPFPDSLTIRDLKKEDTG